MFSCKQCGQLHVSERSEMGARRQGSDRCLGLGEGGALSRETEGGPGVGMVEQWEGDS